MRVSPNASLTHLLYTSVHQPVWRVLNPYMCSTQHVCILKPTNFVKTSALKPEMHVPLLFVYFSQSQRQKEASPNFTRKFWAKQKKKQKTTCLQALRLMTHLKY